MRAASSTEEFGAGWSAVLVDAVWVVLEPVEGSSANSRPVEIPVELACIVTSDNPQGRARSDEENHTGRLHLHGWASDVDPHFLATAGGIGGASHPTGRDAYEAGVLVRVDSYDEAVQHCCRFDQAAVYVLDGDERVLVNTDGTVVRRQRYRVHRVAQQAIPPAPR